MKEQVIYIDENTIYEGHETELGYESYDNMRLCLQHHDHLNEAKQVRLETNSNFMKVIERLYGKVRKVGNAFCHLSDGRDSIDISVPVFKSEADGRIIEPFQTFGPDSHFFMSPFIQKFFNDSFDEKIKPLEDALQMLVKDGFKRIASLLPMLTNPNSISTPISVDVFCLTLRKDSVPIGESDNKINEQVLTKLTEILAVDNVVDFQVSVLNKELINRPKMTALLGDLMSKSERKEMPNGNSSKGRTDVFYFSEKEDEGPKVVLV